MISCLAFSGVLLSWAFVSRQRVSLAFRILYVPLEERAVDVVASPAFDPVETAEFPRLFADALVVRRLGFGETIDVPLTFAFRQSAPPVGDLFGRGAVGRAVWKPGSDVSEACPRDVFVDVLNRLARGVAFLRSAMRLSTTVSKMEASQAVTFCQSTITRAFPISLLRTD